jgi:hypothetical protein
VGEGRGRENVLTVEVRRGARVTFHNMEHRFLSDGEHEYFLKEHPETRGNAIVK